MQLYIGQDMPLEESLKLFNGQRGIKEDTFLRLLSVIRQWSRTPQNVFYSHMISDPVTVSNLSLHLHL